MNALEEACKAIDLLRAEKKKLEEENASLRKRNKELQKRVSDAGWQYEKDHADDWRKPVEMGML